MTNKQKKSKPGKPSARRSRQAIRYLISSLTSRTAASTIISISNNSLSQRFHYNQLQQAGRWADLGAICISDLRHCSGDMLAIIAGVQHLHQIRSANRQTLKALEWLTEHQRRRRGPKLKLDRATKRQLKVARELLAETISAKNYGQFAMAAAHNLLRLQAAALRQLVEADANQAAIVGDSETIARVAETFATPASTREMVRVWKLYSAALHRRQQRIYVSAVNGGAQLPSRLNDLALWVMRNIRGMASLQATITLLLQQSDKSSDPGPPSLARLSVAVGLLLREAVASYMAANVGFFGINGVPLHRDARDLFSRAGIRPLHGRLEIGKRTTARRLATLSDSLLVRIEGTLTKTAFVKKGPKTKGYFLATLQDYHGNAIQVAAPANLVQHGLSEGSHVRVSGFWRKRGSSIFKKKHVELQRLDIEEVYAPDIWKVAFLNLATPYFNMWPENYHVAYQLKPAALLTNSGALSTTGICDDEQEAVDKAKEAFEKAQFTLDSLTGLSTGLLLLGGFWCSVSLGFGCVFASIALIAAAIRTAQAQQSVNEAAAKLGEAMKALNACLESQPTTGTGGWPVDGGIGPGGVTGVGGFSLDDGSMPSWIDSIPPDGPTDQSLPSFEDDPFPPFPDSVQHSLPDVSLSVDGPSFDDDPSIPDPSVNGDFSSIA
jgi:hypothetical protein